MAGDATENSAQAIAGSEHLQTNSEHLPPYSEHLRSSSEHLRGSSEHLGSEHEAYLLRLAAPARDKGKVPRALMESTILALCHGRWLSLRELARLLDREVDTLRNHYIRAMLDDGRLEARVPGNKTHRNQAYRAKA